MKNRNYLIVGTVVVIVGASVAGWLVRSQLHGMPSGPALPPQPPDREFSEEIIALNNQATEMQYSDPEAAMRLYDEALNRDPDYWVALANKVNLLLDSEEYAQADACFEKLTELRPRAAEYYVGRALCLHRLGRDDEVQDQLLKAISAYDYRMEESPFHARLNRAAILFVLNRDRLARAELEELEKDETEHAAEMVAALRKAMDKAEKGDRWALVE